MKSRNFIDSVPLYVKAGNGGIGCVSYHREKYRPRGGPDGGDGGRGGDVVLKADPDISSLVNLYYNPHQTAENGRPGSGNGKSGRNAGDLTVSVPCGTEIWDFSANPARMIGDLVEPGTTLQVARGGRGGLGNSHFKRMRVRADHAFSPAEKGETVNLRLELKLVSDVGLIGFPNAGKSSLLSALTAATPKVAAYPFTTLNPVIGTLQFDDYTSMTLADIPGLIEGAHDGVGLGDKFLRHVERASFFIYVIDIAGIDGRDPSADYENLQRELWLYKRVLADRPCMVAANKIDMADAGENLDRFIESTGTKPIPVSAMTGAGLDALKTELHRISKRKADIGAWN